MAQVEIKINRRLDILWFDKIYKSSVQDISDNYIAIAAPILGGVYLPLHKGDTFTVLYYVDEKELYEFQAVVAGIKFEEKVKLVVIEYPKNLRLVQRREYVRVDISHSIKYVKSVIEDDLKKAPQILDDNKGKTGTILDISGGGLKLKTIEKMELGNFITADINLLGRSLRVNGKIVRVVIDEFNNYVCGVAYIDMNERTRDKIIQLTFEIMRKQMKTL